MSACEPWAYDTLANFVDSLEHLEEKTPEELAELSARVREYVARR